MTILRIADDIASHAIPFACSVCAIALAVAIAMLYPEVAKDTRDRLVASWRRLGKSLSSSIIRPIGRRLRQLASVESWTRAVRHARRPGWPMVALAGVLAVPAAMILSWRGDAHLASFARSATYDTHPGGAVASLLRGEHLTPPATLPPAIFATRDVELVRPRLAYASRAWELLDDAFAQRLLRVYQLMKQRHGYDMVLIEGYRSPERQNELAAIGTHVTRAAAYQSYHQYGLAADSAFLKDGHLIISEKDPWAMRGYRLFGELAAELELTWGGNWTLMDFGHVELRRRRVDPPQPTRNS
jgi:peptidoglycan L-alanyl-D-glutamate endopeptidase CwlK